MTLDTSLTHIQDRTNTDLPSSPPHHMHIETVKKLLMRPSLRNFQITGKKRELKASDKLRGSCRVIYKFITGTVEFYQSSERRYVTAQGGGARTEHPLRHTCTHILV